LTEYHNVAIHDVIKALNSDSNGLTDKEAKSRLETHGFNELKAEKKDSPLKIFLSQFKDFLVWVLIAASIISIAIGEYTDFIVIIAIVVINAVLGFYNEFRAEKSIEALMRIAALKAKALRDGKLTQLEARELVPGDIIFLETGEKIPADARIIEEMSLETDESALTGESLPVRKSAGIIIKAQVADQKNMLFSSTIVTKGKGKAIVVSTGMKTEIGKIAKMVQETDNKTTPLQQNVEQFGKWLGVLILIVCAVVFTVSLLRNFLVTGSETGKFIIDMFMIAVSLAVAAIPEGLPIIVTITLAIGVQRMVKRNALIRKLPAVETLGCTTVICSDKTGTLTCNEMTVRKIYANNLEINVSGAGYNPEGAFTDDKGNKVRNEELSLILQIGLLCNDATLTKNNKWEIFGDPTEGALLVSAGKIGLKKEELEEKYPRKADLPFDSERKLMTTIHNIKGELTAYTKGAPDILITRCNFIYANGKVTKMTSQEKEEIMRINQEMASHAMRVLGFAFKILAGTEEKDRSEHNMIFVGLQGMIDPPRKEVKEAIEKCHLAGIKTVMITGDHKLTAIAVAKELGLYHQGDNVLTGEELDELSEDKFMKVIEDVIIYARVSPAHKVRICESFKKKGHVVAMTGDGVNDAPAVKKSDIGISMGITGTDVAKEASDMVLTDDNFASIVNAIEEGRGIFNNIRKFIEYLLSCNMAEVLVIFIAVLFGMPLPLVAVQILWMNLVTDGVPALALGVEPINPDVMKKKPRNPKERIISKPVLIHIIIVAVLMTAGTLSLFLMNEPGTDKARTIAFTAIVMFELVYALSNAIEGFKFDVRKHIPLIGAFLISLVMQLLVIYTPMSSYFKTVHLNIIDWAWILGFSAIMLVLLEIKDAIVAVRE
jgi:P-type Ca2+ transporter type 2C